MKAIRIILLIFAGLFALVGIGIACVGIARAPKIVRHGPEQTTNRYAAVTPPVTQQQTTITEVRKITDKEFCAPVMVNGRDFRITSNPDIAGDVRINGDRIVHLSANDGVAKLGSGINTLEFKADSTPADVYVYIKSW